MFGDFYNAVLKWLQENNYLEQVRSLSQPLLSKNERHPETRTLWDRFLRLMIPEAHRVWFFQNPHYFELALSELASLGQYASQQRISSLVSHYFSNFLDYSVLKSVENGIFDFHAQIPNWEDGSWHEQVNSERYEVVPRLNKLAGFRSEWQTAEFLALCGYLYPSSKSSFKAWLRFAGEGTVAIQWSSWLDLLQSVAATPLEIYTVDFILKSIFQPRPGSGIPNLCTSPSDCFSCALSEECSYFQNDVVPDKKSNLENMIRLDDAEEVEMEQLVSYLAENRYTKTPIQQSLLKAFPNGLTSLSSSVKAGSADEGFLLFLKGLKYLSDSLSMTIQSAGGTVYNKSEIIFRDLKPELSQLKQEAFYTLILDNRYRKIHLKLITRGTLNRSLIHPREVFAPAIQLRAAAVILVHNHPSGDPQPSTQDIEITKRLTEVGNIVGINVVDHVIIGHDNYFSFVDESLI